ncbi:MAG: zinc-binding dehydrogenase [Anaerolineae bacterium]
MLADDHRESLASALHLAQALAGTSWTEAPVPALVLVTQGAQRVEHGEDGVAVAQAPLWGLGRVIALEHPELRCLRVDLDPKAEQQASLLLAELLRDGVEAEDQVAYRGGVRYVPRLRPMAARGDASLAGDTPRRLEISLRGTLDSLVLQPALRIAPGPGQVEIRVRAAGLNFRDVMNALGLYPGDAGLLGGECAGVVVAVGEGVKHVVVGDEVIAIAPGTFGTHATTGAQLVVRMPRGLSFQKAATIPIAFLTAYYALKRLADLQPGQRVLIHAASGGVGQAAVQVAQRAGAQIYATAGSPAKREFLRGQGIPAVMSSRSLDFAGEVMAATDGRGVDVVLNSLAGEFIPQSLAVLSRGGRFLEIGKVGIWDAS